MCDIRCEATYPPVPVEVGPARGGKRCHTARSTAIATGSAGVSLDLSHNHTVKGIEGGTGAGRHDAASGLVDVSWRPAHQRPPARSARDPSAEQHLKIRRARRLRRDRVMLARLPSHPGPHADAFHPMHHPIHLHGQRFLVLSRDGVENRNLAWKDTVLVPVGVDGGPADGGVEPG